MGIGYCNRCQRYDGHDTNCPTVVGETGEQQLRSRIEQLTARVRELEEENARLHEQVDLQIPAIAFKQLTEQLAVSQAYAEQLLGLIPARTPGGFVTLGKNYMEAEDKFNDPYSKMCKFKRVYLDKCEKALALPRDTSALDAYVAEKVKELQETVSRWERDFNACSKENEQYQDIAARQGRQITELTRQCDFAVEAATKARNGALQAASVCSKQHPVYRALLNMADVIDGTIFTIKESERK